MLDHGQPTLIETRPPGRAASRVLAAITPRAVVLGALLVVVLVITNPYLAFVADFWTVGSGAVMNGPIAALFLLVLFNGVLKRYLPRYALTRPELLVSYVMTIVCVGLAQAGGLPYVLTTTTAPFYFATPENQWTKFVWPYYPVSLQLSDLRYAGWFWEGAPPGAGVPWAAWWRPLMMWGSFVFALTVATACLASLVRRDWIERQRLTFPIVELPLAITGDDPHPSLGTSLLRNRLFWVGCAIPALYLLTDRLNILFPNVPAVRLQDIEVGSAFIGMPLPWQVWSDITVSIIFPVIGISYLAPRDVSLSLWLFYVVYRLHMLVWAACGVDPSSGAAIVDPHSFHAFMETGGVLAFCGVILYRSRGAIAMAARSLFRRGPAEDDPTSPLSERWALIGFVLANVFLYAWLARTGMPAWNFAALMGLAYASMLCAGYLVASAGVMFPSFSANPSSVLLRTLGGAAFAPQAMAMTFAVDSMFLTEVFPYPFPQMLHGGKIFHSARLRGRGFSWVALGAIAITIVFGFWALLVVIQPRGASTLGIWPWAWPKWYVCGPLAAEVRSPSLPDPWLRGALGLGAIFVLALVALQARFLWWPLSPYGFFIGSTYLMNHMLWASIFIGWAAASLTLRYGGLRLFRQLRPIFLGLVLGYYIMKLPIAGLAVCLGITTRTHFFAY